MCDCTGVQTSLCLLLAGQCRFYGWRQKQDKTRQQQDNNLIKLEASLAPAKADVGAEAKADQKIWRNGD